jgi:hypothetical protein
MSQSDIRKRRRENALRVAHDPFDLHNVITRLHPRRIKARRQFRSIRRKSRISRRDKRKG